VTQRRLVRDASSDSPYWSTPSLWPAIGPESISRPH